MKNGLILLAGGSGTRARLNRPKQFFNIENSNIIEYFLSNLDSKLFDIIVIGLRDIDKKKYLNDIKKKFILRII